MTRAPMTPVADATWTRRSPAMTAAPWVFAKAMAGQGITPARLEIAEAAQALPQESCRAWPRPALIERPGA